MQNVDDCKAKQNHKHKVYLKHKKQVRTRTVRSNEEQSIKKHKDFS